MSSFGLTPKSSDTIPLGAVAIPGNTSLFVLQGSLLSRVDAIGNQEAPVATSDAIRELLLNGQHFHAHFQQTIGGAAQGYYGMSLFNASNSGKSVAITAVRGWVAANAPLMYAFRATTNPAMGNTAAASNDNLGSSTTSVAAVTYNTASGGVSFPGSTNFASVQKATNDTAEFRNDKGIFVYMPSGTALSLEVVMFVVNSAQYGIVFEWAEL